MTAFDPHLLRSAFLVAALTALGCGSSAPPLALPPDDVGSGGGAVAGAPGHGASPGGASASDGGVGASGCTPEATNYIYLIDAVSGFYRLDPSALAVSRIGTLRCPSRAMPYSLSVRRDGTAFTVFLDGTLHYFDVRTLACANLDFVPGQAGFDTFGMGFATDGVTTAETLYVSQAHPSPGTSRALGTIDLATLRLTAVGAYDALDARAELTGTGDGRLFGAFEGAPYVIAEIDPSRARILSQAPQPTINYPADRSNFAFASWGGAFWLFVGPGSSTDVFRFDPSSQETTKLMTLPSEIVGAGVSTCAPVRPLE